jgi:radical SAM superfamily enzyme
MDVKWFQIEQNSNKAFSIEWIPLPPRDILLAGGFDLWSGFAHNIGRTHKFCVYCKELAGMFKWDIDSQGRAVLVSYTGERWGNTTFDKYRPEIHRTLSGTWIEGRWEHSTYDTGLNYQPTIVGNGDTIYDMCMENLDGLFDTLSRGNLSVKDDSGKDYPDLVKSIPQVKNHEGLLKESERLHSIIGSLIPVMPPQLAFHHYHGIPVRVQNGCGGGCTFCDFYAKRKIEILPLEDVIKQIDQMAEYFGEEVDHVDTIVILDGDALTVPTDQLGAELEHAIERFGLIREQALVQPKDIGHAFVRAKTVLKKTSEELAYLKDKGLHYVNMGLETGCKELLRIAKPGQKLEDFKEAAERLTSVGIKVSVNILAGLGGKKFEKNHVAETLSFVRALPQGIATFLAYLERKPDSRYIKQEEEDFIPLERDELIKQAEVFMASVPNIYRYLFIPM